jgi:hypothetical protein
MAEFCAFYVLFKIYTLFSLSIMCWWTVILTTCGGYHEQYCNQHHIAFSPYVDLISFCVYIMSTTPSPQALLLKQNKEIELWDWNHLPSITEQEKRQSWIRSPSWDIFKLKLFRHFLKNFMTDDRNYGYRYCWHIDYFYKFTSKVNGTITEMIS